MSAPQDSRLPLVSKMPSWRTSWEFLIGLVLGSAAAVGALALAGIFPSDEADTSSPPPLRAKNALSEETEQIQQTDLVVKEPVIKDAETSDHNETDNDLPFEESIGEGGLSDAPFEGPANNAAIGIGGGAGGAFAGRGGMRLPAEQPSTESYDYLPESGVLRVADHPLSTFSIDVDTASYAIVRRMLTDGRMPPHGAVRVEELVNYFPYRYEPPTGQHPFAVHVEVAACPWNLEHRLAKIGLKGREVARADRPAGNLVFLLDVSGSMANPNKLPLVKASMKLLLGELTGRDKVAIVVYAGASGLVLAPTSCDERARIEAAIDDLSPGGSTNGASGIDLAYQVAKAAFVPGGTNRVILCTDGDFNVGTTSQDELVRMVEARAKDRIFLSVFGFGMGNLKDSMLEKLADKGDGNYGYVDDEKEARKSLVEQAGGTLVTIAKDVKIQVEFNPAQVAAYRLVGYENRRLEAQDFNDDKKDAGEIGAGHTVTALYEVVPAGQAVGGPSVDPLKYRRPAPTGEGVGSPESLTVKVRYKQPEGDVSTLLEVPVTDFGAPYGSASPEFKFAASVAAFGMLLRDSAHKGSASYDGAAELAGEGIGDDPGGYRREFVGLVAKAKALAGAAAR